jgi:putative sigma-54 modulation protein
MKIEVHGRAVQVTDELRAKVEKRFAKIAKQVSESTTLRLDLREMDASHGPAEFVVEAAIHLKGTILRATDRSRDIEHAVRLVSDELATQVKRHHEKRRDHRAIRKAARSTGGAAAA